MAKTAFGAPVVYKNGPGETQWVNDLPVQANPNYTVYFNDFLNNVDGFNAPVTGTATAALGTDGINGTIVMTSDATTDNSGVYVGINQENFRILDTNKKLWYSTYAQVTNPGDQDFFAGFSIAVATTPLNVFIDGTTTSKVCFEMLDGSAFVTCKTLTGGSSTVTTTRKAMVANTYHKFDILVYATSTTNRVATFFIDNILVATHTTNIPASSVALTPGFAEISGSATGTMSGTVDYLFVAKER